MHFINTCTLTQVNMGTGSGSPFQVSSSYSGKSTWNRGSSCSTFTQKASWRDGYQDTVCDRSYSTGRSDEAWRQGRSEIRCLCELALLHKAASGEWNKHQSCWYTGRWMEKKKPTTGWTGSAYTFSHTQVSYLALLWLLAQTSARLSYCSAIFFKVDTPQKTAELVSEHTKFKTTAGSARLGQNALLTFKMSDVMVFRGISRGSCICTSCSSARIHGKSWGQEHKVLLAEPSSALRWVPPQHLLYVKLKKRQEWLREETGNPNLPQQQNLTLTRLSLTFSIIIFSYSIKLWGQPTSLTAKVTSHFFKRYTLSCPELPCPVHYTSI